VLVSSLGALISAIMRDSAGFGYLLKFNFKLESGCHLAWPFLSLKSKTTMFLLQQIFCLLCLYCFWLVEPGGSTVPDGLPQDVHDQLLLKTPIIGVS
jgi:hypothetical protein